MAVLASSSEEIVMNGTRRWAIVGHRGMVIGAVLCLALISRGLLTYRAAFARGRPEAGPTSVILALGSSSCTRPLVAWPAGLQASISLSQSGRGRGLVPSSAGDGWSAIRSGVWR